MDNSIYVMKDYGHVKIVLKEFLDNNKLVETNFVL